MGFLFVLVFILGIIFVLLPFLETTPPPSAATAVQARPRPQIFTSNPLTTLVKRIVNALQTEWDKKREKRRLAVARMQGKRQLSPTDYRAALVHSLPQDGTPAEEIALPETEEYDGNWLISPQISPKDAAAKGMHEVSITDEPAQNTETINIPLPQEAAALSAQSESLPTDNAAQNAPMQLARANTILDISLPATQVQGQQAPTVKTKSEVALQNLLDILYPEKKIEKIIRNMADVKFGMLPSTEENKSAKATYIKETTKQAIEELRRLQTQKIHRLLTEGPQPDDLQTDYLAEYLQACAEEGIEPEEHPIRILIRDNDGNTYYTNTSTTEIKNEKYLWDWMQKQLKKFFSTGGKENDPQNGAEETGSTGGKENDPKNGTEGTVSTEGEPNDESFNVTVGEGVLDKIIQSAENLSRFTHSMATFLATENPIVIVASETAAVRDVSSIVMQGLPAPQKTPLELPEEVSKFDPNGVQPKENFYYSRDSRTILEAIESSITKSNSENEKSQ